MAERVVVTESPDGRVVEVRESPTERTARLEEAAEDSKRRFAMTDSQRRNVARLRRRPAAV